MISIPTYLSKTLASHITTSKSEAVYKYAFEIILSTFSSALSILITGFLVHTIIPSSIFIIIYFTMRLYCGGYHSKTYFRCFISTNITHFAYIGLCLVLSVSCSYFRYALLIFDSITICCLAPVRNSKHPLSERKIRKGRKRALIQLFLSDCISVILLVLKTIFSNYIIGSLTAVAVLMIIPCCRKEV